MRCMSSKWTYYYIFFTGNLWKKQGFKFIIHNVGLISGKWKIENVGWDLVK